MPKIHGNEIRMGNILEHNGGLWIAVKIDHVKPGKGGAFAQVEMKNLRNGSKLNERFRSADKVEKVFDAVYVCFDEVSAINDAITYMRFRSNINNIVAIGETFKFGNILFQKGEVRIALKHP